MENETPIVKNERLAPISEAAHRLGVSELTVRDWILDRKITSHKLGGRRLVPVSEIERLIAKSRQPARDELLAAIAAA